MNTVETHASEENTLARYSYLAGIAGIAVILLMGIAGAGLNVLKGNSSLSYDRYTILTLVTCAGFMFVVELATRIRMRGNIIALSPKIRNREYSRFAIECLLNYILELAVLFIAVIFYKYANEYGFKNNAPFYRPWFQVMDILLKGYIVAGLPYIIVTRLFQYDLLADRKEPAYLIVKLLVRFFPGNRFYNLMERLDFFSIKDDLQVSKIDECDMKVFYGLLVKMFFIPVMTVFFFSQFSHLINNNSFIYTVVDSRSGIASLDFYNISFSIIFSIDVALAWCGYTVSSRWIKNSMFSVEPTLAGWAVAVVCYPPFRQFLGFYFNAPSEKAFMMIQNRYLVVLFAVMSVLSYIVYLSATVVFGLRFSNLTHRGIITKGPYRFVRHPAYAAKNFSWWCIMFPVIVYQFVFINRQAAVAQLFGLLLMTCIYYFRALTEERHLMIDPDYHEYCSRVKYRFIPGIL